MQGIPERIQACQLIHFYNADSAYGEGVAKKLGFDMKKCAPWTKFSLPKLIKKTAEQG